nr:PREDICTED: coiled-coil domain-containing protein 62 isoform X2 [Latimeria chalumnae]|eukprot:XP_014339781.1 PREDICTED: coiled-coil domain-containing protein 62 isoform X2 [Latimeria chalumnae]
MESDLLPDASLVRRSVENDNFFLKTSSLAKHTEPWHSTPKPKFQNSPVEYSLPTKSVGAPKQNFGSTQGIFHTASLTLPQTSPTLTSKSSLRHKMTSSRTNHTANIDLESSTIQKQRHELQLLITELKDRDQELNDMVLAHQKQLLAWEVDRQRILTLEQKCAKLENELHVRNEMIRALTKRINILESQQRDRRTALESTQKQLWELSRRASEASNQNQDLEEKNKSLNSLVLELSAHVGQMEAREQEFVTLLKLKDKDIIEATDHITDATTKFKKLEGSLYEARMGEASAKKEMQDYKQKLKMLKCEIIKLKENLGENTAENNEQREEIIHLKQENCCLRNELTLAGEREKRKEQLLELAKSKQDRTDTELYNLRQNRFMKNSSVICSFSSSTWKAQRKCWKSRKKGNRNQVSVFSSHMLMMKATATVITIKKRQTGRC